MSSLEIFNFTNLLAGTDPDVVTKVMTIKSGQVISKRQILAVETSSGKYVHWIAGGSGGQEIARGIACDDIDASGGDVNAPVYIAGCFNSAALEYGSGGTAALAFEQLRNCGIVIKAIQNPGSAT